MRIIKGTLALAVLGALLVTAGTGCKTLDEHRQLEMDHRTLQAEKKQVESDLYDCRSVTDNLRTRIKSLEGELETAERLADNFEEENERLAQRCDELTKIVDKIAGGRSMSEPVIIERMLPPALDAALKEFAAQFPDMVTYDSKRGAVKWASDTLFALASVVVRDSAKESLRQFADIINSPAATGFEAMIVGHTDNIPIKRSETMKMHPTNWHLSVHRAISVSSVLQGYGLDPARVGILGFGEYRPVEGNNTESGRAKNRRVEVFIVRKDDVLAAGNELEGATGGALSMAQLGASGGYVD